MFTRLIQGSMIVAAIGFTAFAAIVAYQESLFYSLKEQQVADKPTFNILPGDMIQWESGGTFMFDEPREVTEIHKSEKGTYVFVEESTCGIPIEQVIPMS